MSLPHQNQKPVGLKAIAQAAGVSHLTVSRALRNESSIGAATRFRIRKLASRGVRGIIIGPVPDACRELHLDWARFASVALGHSFLSPALHYVACNHAATIELIYGNLPCRLGYRRIGFCGRSGSIKRNRHLHLSTYFRRLYLDGISSDAASPLLYEAVDQLTKADVVPWMKTHRFGAVIAMDYPILIRLLDAGAMGGEAGIAGVSLLPEDAGAVSGVLEDLYDAGAPAVELVDTMLKTGRRGVPRRRHAILIDGDWRSGTTTPSITRRGKFFSKKPREEALLSHSEKEQY